MAITNTFGKEIIPENEKYRLAELHKYDLIHSSPLKSFNSIAKIAAKHFNVPIALISLVDAEEVYFKGNFGMGTTASANRGVSLCSLGILSDDPTVFTQVLDEPCLMVNPLITGDFGLRFYAGVPLKTISGYNIGTLCIVDKKERGFSGEEEKMLQEFADIVMNEVELRHSAGAHHSNQVQAIHKTAHELAVSNIALTDSREQVDAYHFISNHNFQEPLRKIQLYTGLLLDKHIANDDYEGLDKAKRVIALVDDFRTMIQDIDAYNAIVLDPGNVERVDMNNILELCLSRLASQVADKGAIVNIEKLPVVNAIAVQIQELFYQLLHNSLRFSRDGVAPVIDISWRMLSDEDRNKHMELSPLSDFYEISVCDNGVGIDGEYARSIFNLFSRLEAGNVKKTSGMGLAYCRKIVRNHRGTIFFTSTPNENTCFSVVLPVE